MARDKRGQPTEPDVDEVLDELVQDDGGSFVAGPTSRNEAGDTKRAAAKATGLMGASNKIDPDLAVDPDGDRPKSGSKAGLHSFQEVPPEKGVTDHRVTRPNAEIVDEPISRPARRPPAGRRRRGAPPAGRRAPRQHPHGLRPPARAGARQPGERPEGHAGARPPDRERGRRPLAILDRRREAAEALRPGGRPAGPAPAREGRQRGARLGEEPRPRRGFPRRPLGAISGAS